MQAFYALAFTAAGLVSLAVAAASWRRRPASGALSLALLSFTQFLWSTVFALQWAFTDLSPSFGWLFLRLAALQFMPTLTFIVMLEFSGYDSLLTRKNLFALSIQPILTLLFVLAEPIHGLYLAGAIPAMKFLVGGPAWWFNVVYSFGLYVFGSSLLLARVVLKSPFRNQSAIILIATLLPPVYYAAQLLGFDPVPGMNTTPFAFAAAGALEWFALERLGLFTIVPIARDRLIEQSPEGIIVFDPGGRIADINAVALQMTAAPESCIGRHAHECFSDHADVVVSLIGETREVSEQPRGEFTTRDGRVIEAIGSMVCDARGDHLATLMTLRDISESKSAAAELENRSRELADALDRTHRILTAMSDGVILVDSENTVVKSNPAASRILGIDLDRFAGQPVQDAIKEFDPEFLIRDATERDAVSTITVKLENDNTATIEVSAIREMQTGQPQSLFVIRDETGKLLAERMQRDFVANVSHELQTPLTGLSLLAETIPKALQTDPDRAVGFVKQLSGGIEQLTRMTHELMALARASDTSSFQVNSSVVDFTAVVRECVSTLRPLALSKDQRLVIKTAEPIRLIGDEIGLRTVCSNLVENAIRYTNNGGHIEVSLVDQEIPHRGRCAQLVVSDDGIGVPEQDKHRIFERFYRVDKARSRATGGTGLGLSIVRLAVEQHGGTIDVSSTLGEGTTFIVTLPLESR